MIGSSYMIGWSSTKKSLMQLSLIFLGLLQHPNRHHLLRTYFYRGTLYNRDITVLMGSDDVHMMHVIGIKLALAIIFFVGKLAFL
jgi:hypothetical protein